MNETELGRLIRNTILLSFAGQGMFYLPVAVSARHVHLSRGDFETLFGRGASMTHYRDLSQPGQFASGETVEVMGPKGSIKKVRVLGPERNESQVEISVSDSFTLGIKPFIRMSGTIAGTPGCTLTGPAGRVELKQGVIAAARHVHMSPAQADAYGLKEGDRVFLKTPAPRESLMGDIVVRIGNNFDLEAHLDTDEANGNGIFCGTILEMGKASLGNKVSPGNQNPGFLREGGGQSSVAGEGPEALSVRALELVTERDINKALARGEKTLYCTAKGFISPAAADRAREKGIELCRLHG